MMESSGDLIAVHPGGRSDGGNIVNVATDLLPASVLRGAEWFGA
jgi:hypothetical protein